MTNITIVNRSVNHSCGAYEGSCTCHVLTTLYGRTDNGTLYINVMYHTDLNVGDVVPLDSNWIIED